MNLSQISGMTTQMQTRRHSNNDAKKLRQDRRINIELFGKGLGLN